MDGTENKGDVVWYMLCVRAGQELSHDMNSENMQERIIEKPVVVRQNRSIWGPALGAGFVVLAGFSFYEASQINGLRDDLSARRQETAQMQSQAAQQNSALAGTVSDLQSQLASNQQDLSTSIAKAQTAAQRHADAVAKTLAQKDAEAQDAINTELAGVKNTTADVSSRVDGVGASVETVKTDPASTKETADKTASDLQRATGDMGVMSGLIATNSQQIEYLRSLGDRNIYEFTIAKKNGMQKVGDVQLRLTKSDSKKNRYTVVVLADDKYVEKRDKTTNEPVQFYATPGTRTPDEIVVNQVDKDTIKGYLSTPKVNTARN
jgi:hypothetical protein